MPSTRTEPGAETSPITSSAHCGGRAVAHREAALAVGAEAEPPAGLEESIVAADVDLAGARRPDRDVACHHDLVLEQH